MQVISDNTLSESLRSKAERIVDPPWHLKTNWLREHGWTAVPVEKGRHFEEEAAETVAEALQAVGLAECFAVATEPMGEYPSAYRLAPTKEDLLAFSAECAGLNFVLIDEALSFAILCTADEYNVVAGQFDFVRIAVGMNIKAAREAFREFASDEWWEGRLLQVADKYERLS
jgi:hypothetical protein